MAPSKQPLVESGQAGKAAEMEGGGVLLKETELDLPL